MAGVAARAGTLTKTNRRIDHDHLGCDSPPPRRRSPGRAANCCTEAGHGTGLLITVRGDEPPRAHPISVGIVDDGLYAFILPSPKLQDLEADGRYALHAHFDPHAPDEFLIRGRVRVVPQARREVLAADWSWSVGQAQLLRVPHRGCALRRAPDRR